MATDDFNPEAWFSNFSQILSKRYEGDIAAIKSAGAKLSTVSTVNPVRMARQYLIEAYGAFSSGQPVKARQLLSSAIVSANSGAISPDAAEWAIDGPEIGRGHACMWGAIARVFSHKQAELFAYEDATLADAWFGSATVIFLTNGEETMAGRSLQEWAESRRLYKDEEGAQILFLAALCLFMLTGNQTRMEMAGKRTGESGPVAMESSFFLNRPASQAESKILSSVLGASNSLAFYNSMS